MAGCTQESLHVLPMAPASSPAHQVGHPPYPPPGNPGGSPGPVHDPADPLPTTHAPPRHPSGVDPLGPNGILPLDFGSPTPIGYTPPADPHGLRDRQFLFGSPQGNGAAQTIAIVDAYDDPAFVDSTTAHDIHHQRPGRIRSAIGLPIRRASSSTISLARPAELPHTDLAAAGIPGTGKWKKPWTWSGPMPLPPGQHRPRRGHRRHQLQQPGHRRGHGRRLPGVSVVSMSWRGGEFGGERARQRPSPRRPPPGRDVPGRHRRQRLALGISGLLAECRGGRRHHSVPQRE